MQSENSQSISWTASEYIDHQRGFSWYLLLTLATSLVTGLTYIFTRDYFAAGCMVTLGIMVAAVAHWQPRQVEYQLTSKGLHFGDKFYAYSQFKAYSIIREAELTSLALHPIKKLSPPLYIFIDEDQEADIVAIVGQHLPDQPASVDRIDRLSRRLRF